jgi:hypothetical protein
MKSTVIAVALLGLLLVALPPYWAGTLLLVLCFVLVALPPKYDPAIRIKEWQQDHWK